MSESKDTCKEPAGKGGIGAMQSWPQEAWVCACDACEWTFLLPHGRMQRECPHCFRSRLREVDAADRNVHDPPVPELMIPFEASEDVLARELKAFTRGVRFAPPGFKDGCLQAKLQRVFLPMWLTDVEVRATWGAEVGFDYDVVSFQERFEEKRGGWASRRVNETRIRWEPRMGRLHRTYDNVLTPALVEDGTLRRRLGSYRLKRAKPYVSHGLALAAVRLPDRKKKDAWSDVKPVVRSRASQECRNAAQGDHLREFRWSPETVRDHWTLLLLPVQLTCYKGDRNEIHPLLINGQTGRVSGPRRASMKVAWRVAKKIGMAAAAALIAGLSATLIGHWVEPSVLPLGALGILLSFVLGLAAFWPPLWVWRFNRSQRDPS